MFFLLFTVITKSDHTMCQEVISNRGPVKMGGLMLNVNLNLQIALKCHNGLLLISTSGEKQTLINYILSLNYCTLNNWGAGRLANQVRMPHTARKKDSNSIFTL